jgi:hypothetical protein
MSNHACIFSFFAGSQKKFAVSPAWSELAHFALSLQIATGDQPPNKC